MIFSNQYLQELREKGVNSQNLKTMVLNLAARCQQLEYELKGEDDENNGKEHAASESKVISAGLNR